MLIGSLYICSLYIDQDIQKICSVCEEVIEGTYYMLNNQIYCEKDYKVSRINMKKKTDNKNCQSFDIL